MEYSKILSIRGYTHRIWVFHSPLCAHFLFAYTGDEIMPKFGKYLKGYWLKDFPQHKIINHSPPNSLDNIWGSSVLFWMNWVLHGNLHVNLEPFSGSFGYYMRIYSPILDVLDIALYSYTFSRVLWLLHWVLSYSFGHWQRLREAIALFWMLQLLHGELLPFSECFQYNNMHLSPSSECFWYCIGDPLVFSYRYFL